MINGGVCEAHVWSNAGIFVISMLEKLWCDAKGQSEYTSSIFLSISIVLHQFGGRPSIFGKAGNLATDLRYYYFNMSNSMSILLQPRENNGGAKLKFNKLVFLPFYVVNAI